MQKKKILSLAIAIVIIGVSLFGVTTAEKSYSVLENGEIQICGVGYYLEAYGDNCMIVQDRNLGATTTGVGQDAPATSYGDYYQWGDNTVYTIQNWNSGNIKSGYIWGGDSMSELDAYIAASTYDRSAMRGPCPQGYHLPIIAEINALNTILVELDEEQELGLEIDLALQIPNAGYRNYSDGSLTGQGEVRGLWLSAPYNGYGENSTMRHYNYGLFEHDIIRANGLPVRCFKNPGSTSFGDSKIIVSIAEFNGGKNTCTGENYIFSGIVAGPSLITRALTKTFQCAFGESRATTVTIQLSGDLVDSNGNTISSGNVKIKNSAWTSTPAGVKSISSEITTYTGLNNTVTLFNKAASIIGTAEGTGVDIQLEIPGGTPDGTYNGTLVLTY